MNYLVDQNITQSSMCAWVSTIHLFNRVRVCVCVLSEEKVAFSAMLKNGGRFGPFNTDITLKFTKVLSNTGNAYNPATGNLLWLT